MRIRQTQQGISLIELLVAVAILAMALTPLLSVFVQALKVAEKSNKRTIALNLVRDMQEEIRSKAFVDPDVTDTSTWPNLVGTRYFPNGSSATPFGFEEGSFSASDTRLAKFDDVDDYDGWCRGQDCDSCVGTSSLGGLCWDDTPLEAYDGTQYTGEGYPHYGGFTRMVEVFNIYPNISTTLGSDVPSHSMKIGYNPSDPSSRPDKTFNFYDLRPERFDDLSENAEGRTRLKVIRVTVGYKGPAIPDFEVEDSALVVLSVQQSSRIP